MPVRPLSLISQPAMIVADFSDDISVSSTFEVRTQKTTNPQHCGASRQSRVCFNEASNVSYHNTEFCKEATEALWYHSEEYRSFKSDFALAAKEIIRIEKQNKKNQKSYHNVMERVYQSCCTAEELSTSDAKNFNKWVAVTVSRVGLEKVIVRNIRQDKSIRRNELSDSVLEIQVDAAYYSADCQYCTRNQ